MNLNVGMHCFSGAYLLGAKDLVCRFANSASTCVKGHGAQETTVVAKIYLIRHLALASAESTNTKAIHNRSEEKVINLKSSQVPMAS